MLWGWNHSKKEAAWWVEQLDIFFIFLILYVCMHVGSAAYAAIQLYMLDFSGKLYILLEKDNNKLQ